MISEDLKAQAEEVIAQLQTVKAEIMKDKEEIALSIRKDVVKVELKAILNENPDYGTLKNAIETYIDNLI